MKSIVITLCLGIFLFGGLALAEDASSIANPHKEAIQRAMSKNIKDLVEKNGNGKYPMFDPSVRTIVQLKFKGLHDSVEIVGRTNKYFVSCADFVAEDGTMYDLDFFVSAQYGVVATLVHAKNGKKTKYDIH